MKVFYTFIGEVTGKRFIVLFGVCMTLNKYWSFRWNRADKLIKIGPLYFEYEIYM